MAIDLKITLQRKRGASGRDLVDAWSQALSAPRDALEAIGELAEEHVAERFATRTDPYGAAWEPTSPATIEIRAKLGRHDSEHTLAGKHFHRLEGERRVVVGVASGAARAFHFGRPNNRIFGRAPAPIPARGILPLQGRRVVLPPELHDEIMRALREGIRRAVTGAA